MQRKLRRRGRKIPRDGSVRLGGEIECCERSFPVGSPMSRSSPTITTGAPATLTPRIITLPRGSSGSQNDNHLDPDSDDRAQRGRGDRGGAGSRRWYLRGLRPAHSNDLGRVFLYSG